MGILIGIVVLLICVGFVVLMAVSEWSGSAKAPVSTPSAEPLVAKKSPAKAAKKSSSAVKKKKKS